MWLNNVTNTSFLCYYLKFIKIENIRQYLAGSNLINAPSKGVRLSYYLDAYEQIDKVKHLFPESFIVSNEDVVPGLIIETSNEKLNMKQEIKMLPLFKLYLTAAKI